MAGTSSSLRSWGGAGEFGSSHQVSFSDSDMVALEAAEVGMDVVEFCGYNGFGNVLWRRWPCLQWRKQRQ